MQPREVFLQDSFRMRVKGIKSKDLRTLSRATGTQSICERNEDVLHGDSDSAVFKVTNELCPSLFCSFTTSMTHKRPHSAFTQACHSPLLSGSNKHQPAQRCENYQCSTLFRQTMLNRLITEHQGILGNWIEGWGLFRTLRVYEKI